MKNKLKTLNDFEIPKKLSKKELEKNFSKNFKKAYKLLSQDYPILNESFEVKYSLKFETFKHTENLFGLNFKKVKKVRTFENKDEICFSIYSDLLFLEYEKVLSMKNDETFYFFHGTKYGKQKVLFLPFSLKNFDSRLKAKKLNLINSFDDYSKQSFFFGFSMNNNTISLSSIISFISHPKYYNNIHYAFMPIMFGSNKEEDYIDNFYSYARVYENLFPSNIITDGTMELAKIEPYFPHFKKFDSGRPVNEYTRYQIVKVDEEMPNNLNELIVVLNDKAVYKKFYNIYNTIIEKEAKVMIKKEVETKKEIKIAKDDFFNKFDKNDNGIIDIIEEDGFSKLLKKHQDTITKIDQKFVFDFVRLSKSMKEKQDNLTHTFSLLKSADSKLELNEIRDTFEVQHMGYAIMIFEAYRMLLSLIQNDMVTFYELYAEFESNRIFESQWQKDLHQMKKDLTSIKEINKMSLQTLLTIASQLKEMELSMIEGFNMVNQTLEEGFESVNQNIKIMNKSLTNELKGINNKLWWNNLFQVVQIYQNRKTNKLLSR